MKLTIGFVLLCSFAMTFANTTQWFVLNFSGFNLNIYTPTKNGSYPVIVFLTGFAGLMPGSSYSTLNQKIAAQKVIVVAVSQLQNITAEYVEEKFTQFMINITHPQTGLKYLFQNNFLTQNVIPDIENRLILMGHSAGCHVITLYLTHRCGTEYAQVKAVILADPVDGRSPYDMSGDGTLLLVKNLKSFRFSRFCHASTRTTIV